MARYLLTGAAGFIGARVGELLLEQGHQVVGVDDLNDAYDPALKRWRLGRLQAHPRFTFLHLDISARGALEGALAGQTFDAALNLAARAGVRPSVRDPWAFHRTNVFGALGVLDFCRQVGIRKLIQASTSSLYGDHNSRPFREDADISRPLSPYAASKGGAELLCHTYHRLHGLDVTVLRYFTVYGPAGRPDMSVFRFVQWIAEGRPVLLYGDGRQERDFTYVDDVARGTLAALSLPGFEVINLGSDRPVAIRAVIRLLEEFLEKPAHIEARPRMSADVQATWADIDKAKRLLGWRPQVRLEDGLQACVRWYLSERDWAREVRTLDPSVEALEGEA